MKVFRTGRASLFALAVLLGSGGASAQDTPDQLAAMARDARTTRQHAEVARRYRLQAEALDVKAAEQEKQAAALARNAPGIAGQPDVTVFVVNAKPGLARPGILFIHGGGPSISA